MCRYAAPYKPHYACFVCRKTFKRRLASDIETSTNFEAKCPQCTNLMANMGLDFASPPKRNIKQWQHIQKLYSVGITYHSCRCSGPGYIPNTSEKLLEHFEDIKINYLKQLAFWRNRIEPHTQSEIQSDKSKNFEFIIKTNIKKKQHETISNQEAINDWIERIKQIEAKIKTLKTQN